ncbi:uncharacterized protein LY89DRAFT_106800 [Mollisia scopiformis]|uniref:FAD-binding FR-type domain-containing protein n=1 Tax=Mollisia scopiformis TaxID=149040 RepID=A0A194X4X2_MOLSC|nr:uncharacterized protein LY89DRAFT_106800 [Mollisia scopiformis]KUJ15226.1 hypothetical protein LY89DRAFT_106800 [Mollisia scopiformis]
MLQLIVAFASIALLSLSPVRRFKYELFLKLHLLLSFAIIASLFWHLLPGTARHILYPLIAISLWFLSSIIRLGQLLYHNLGKRITHQQVLITKYHHSPRTLGNSVYRKVGALKLQVNLKRPMTVKPGQYLYLGTNDLQLRHRVQSHPFALMWWEDAFAAVGPDAVPTRARQLTFLIEPRDGMTARLTKENSLSHLILDGPYGQDHRLQRYDTVVLAASGIGIAAMLGYAKQLIWWASNSAQRRNVVLSSQARLKREKQ